jgi:hypothetical protein
VASLQNSSFQCPTSSLTTGPQDADETSGSRLRWSGLADLPPVRPHLFRRPPWGPISGCPQGTAQSQERVRVMRASRQQTVVDGQVDQRLGSCSGGGPWGATLGRACMACPRCRIDDRRDPCGLDTRATATVGSRRSATRKASHPTASSNTHECSIPRDTVEMPHCPTAPAWSLCSR